MARAECRSALQAFKAAGIVTPPRSLGGSNRDDSSPAAAPPSRPAPAAAAGPSARPAPRSQLLCPAYATTGRCAKGDLCRLVHSSGGAGAGPSSAAAGGSAGGGGGGSSASGRRTRKGQVTVSNHPLYKVKMCWHWSANGRCSFGSQCHFAHSAAELRPYKGAYREGPLAAAGSGAAGAAPSPLSAEEEAEVEALLHGLGLEAAAGSGAGPAGPAAAGVPAPQPLPSWRAALLQQTAALAEAPQPPLASRQPKLAPAAACGDAFSSPGGPGGLGGSAGGSAGGSSGSSSSGGSAQAGAGDGLDTLRRCFNSLCCPLTLDVFCDPVMAADGHCYERAAIEIWLRGHSTSPLTNEPLAHKELVPCVALRRCVGEVLEHLAAARRLPF